MDREGVEFITGDELCSSYISSYFIRMRVRWVRKAVLMGGARNVYKILVGKPERYTQIETSKVETCCTIKQLYIYLCRLLLH